LAPQILFVPLGTTLVQARKAILFIKETLARMIAGIMSFRAEIHEFCGTFRCWTHKLEDSLLIFLRYYNMTEAASRSLELFAIHTQVVRLSDASLTEVFGAPIAADSMLSEMNESFL
jgi:hypothetical protein